MREITDENLAQKNEELYYENMELRETNKELIDKNKILSKVALERGKKLVNADKKLQYQKKKATILRTIAIVESAALVLAVGVPNIKNAYHRREGTKAIVAELEENNMINKNLEFFNPDPFAPVLLSDGAQLPVSNIGGYLQTIANEAIEDGCSPEKFAVALQNSAVPNNLIEAVTGCNKEDIKNAQLQAYYEIQTKNAKGRS